MIVWLGGPFGAGKTTTARLVAEREPRLWPFDPEWVGYLLRAHLADHPDHRVADFQHYPSWRRLVPVVADELARTLAGSTGQDLLAVQSVLVEDYWRELLDGLSALGQEVRLVVLDAREPALRARIEADEVELGARAWRLEHLAAYAAARPWLHAAADLVVDTTALTPDEVADRVLDVLPRPAR